VSVIRFKGFSIACDAAAGRRDQHWQESAGGAPGRAGERTSTNLRFLVSFPSRLARRGWRSTWPRRWKVKFLLQFHLRDWQFHLRDWACRCPGLHACLQWSTLLSDEEQVCSASAWESPIGQDGGAQPEPAAWSTLAEAQRVCPERWTRPTCHAFHAPIQKVNHEECEMTCTAFLQAGTKLVVLNLASRQTRQTFLVGVTLVVLISSLRPTGRLSARWVRLNYQVQEFLSMLKRMSIGLFTGGREAGGAEPEPADGLFGPSRRLPPRGGPGRARAAAARLCGPGDAHLDAGE